MPFLYLVTKPIQTTGKEKAFGRIDPMQPLDSLVLNQNINSELLKPNAIPAFTSFEEATAYAELKQVAAFNPGKRAPRGTGLGKDCIIVKVEICEHTFKTLTFETKLVTQNRENQSNFYQAPAVKEKELTFAHIQYMITQPLEYQVNILGHKKLQVFSNNNRLQQALRGLAIRSYSEDFNKALSSINSKGYEGLIALCDNYLQGGLLSHKHRQNEVLALKTFLSTFAEILETNYILGEIDNKIQESKANGNRVDGHYHQLLLFTKAMLTYRSTILEEPTLKVENKAAPQPSPVITSPAEDAKAAPSLPVRSSTPAPSSNTMSELTAAISNSDTAKPRNKALEIAVANKAR